MKKNPKLGMSNLGNMAQAAEIPISLAALSNVELIHLWRIENAEAARNRIISEVKKRKLFPDDEGSVSDGGLYPDVEDPNFVSRLLKKSEFADTYSPPLSAEEGSCISGGEFEVTPVQRFVANFLHPRTPYMSALLYHGVGVGKTCAAIQTAEAYLDVYPRRKVMIVAPPTIQAGFYRTIFDIENLRIGVGEALNSAVGCTGDTYLRITGLINERNKDIIEKDVRKAIKSRYEFYGYLQFRNYIRSITNKVSRKGTDAEIRLREIDALKKEFNYRLLIIDEAHNLRDVSSTGVVEEEEETDTVGTEDEKEEAKAGKLLTPFLNNLLDSTDGIKLLLMTATPMFNSVLEIVHIFNLLLRNDKKATITQSQIMDPQGNLIEGAEAIIKPLANAYISFMRGENPNSFPLRLFPEGMDPRGRPIDRVTKENYPKYIFSTRNDLIEVDPEDPEDPESKHRQTKRVEKLPLVKSESLEGSHSFKVMTALTRAGSKMGSNYMIIDSLLQAGNCVFPVGEDTPESFVGLKGFQNNFVRKGKGNISTKDASWLSEENIHKYSPKMATILQFVKKSEGVDFIYSRFVTAGALLMSLILEANGYTMYGRNNLLEQGIQSVGGRQCALCPEREAEHTGDHEFKPANYVLLTGDKDLSPNNKASIDAARGDKNVDGGVVKVVIGSQIAGEGLDLRFIREVHILDAWFHLNKTEQIIGRGIRFRSHCLIEDTRKRNTTVFLHVLTIQGYNNETADLYCYRSALLKAILAGQVSRALKIFAVDCNLRKDVTVLSGLGNRIQVDSQGDERKGAKGYGILIDDMPYTSMCDWMECTYTCDPVVPIDVDSSNNSTYNAFSARYRETKIQKIIQGLFAKQAYWPQDDLKQALIDTGSPLIAINLTLQGILNNRLFRVTHGSREGYIIYKNRYFLFQPEVYKNNSIPLAIRAMDFPIRRDEYTPAVKNKPVVDVVEDKGKESVSKDLWTQLLIWVNGVISGKVTGVSKEIERHIELYTTKLSQESKVYTDKLGMIIFLSKRIEDKETYKKVILEYLWDEWLDNATQLSYYSSKDPVIESIANENIVSSGDYEAFRYIDSQSNILKYICQDGGPCPKGVVDAFSKMDEDIKKTQAVEEKTGKMYGFVVPKTGNMVFKTTNPHKEGGVVKGGQECAIVASGEYLIKLASISRIVADKGVPIKDFNEMNFIKKTVKTDSKKSLEISNNIQGCTLLDLTLRFMDKLKVDNKRWFFRPLEAYYSGHFGRTTAEAKKAVKDEKKALKKVEAEVKKQEKVDKKKPATVAVVAKPVPKLVFTSKTKKLPPAPAMSAIAEDLGDDIEEPLVNTVKQNKPPKHTFVKKQKGPSAPPPAPADSAPPPPAPADSAPPPADSAPPPPPPPSADFAPSPAPAPPPPPPPAPSPPPPPPALTNLAAPPPPGLDVPPPASPALVGKPPSAVKSNIERFKGMSYEKIRNEAIRGQPLSPAMLAMKAKAEARALQAARNAK